MIHENFYSNEVSNASIMGCYVLKKRPMYHPTFSTIHLPVALATWIFLSEAHTIKTYQLTFWSQVLVFSLWMVQQLAIWSSLRINLDVMDPECFYFWALELQSPYNSFSNRNLLCLLILFHNFIVASRLQYSNADKIVILSKP